jgi:hypothetical protein
MIVACQVMDPGSNPGKRTFFANACVSQDSTAKCSRRWFYSVIG